MWIAEREGSAHEEALAMMRADLKAQRDKAVKQLLNRWLKQGQSKCFVSWQVWCEEEALRRRSLQKALLRLTHSCLFAALDGWRNSTIDSIRLREIAAKVLGRMQHGAASAALASWSEHTRWKLHSRRVVTRLLSRWQMREVSACFSAWCDDVQSAHMRAHSAICRSVSVVTSDAEGHVGAESVAQYRVGQIVEVFETRLVKGRLRGRTAEGWVWYVLELSLIHI